MGCGCAGAQGAPGGPAENPVYPMMTSPGAYSYEAQSQMPQMTPAAFVALGIVAGVAAYLWLSS